MLYCFQFSGSPGNGKHPIERSSSQINWARRNYPVCRHNVFVSLISKEWGVTMITVVCSDVNLFPPTIFLLVKAAPNFLM